MKLPVKYDDLKPLQKKEVRDEYIILQGGMCFYCKEPMYRKAPQHIRETKINWDLFPPNFLVFPIHLQHDHNTGLTEGAVHNFCNAVMWQYEGR